MSYGVNSQDFPALSPREKILWKIYKWCVVLLAFQAFHCVYFLSINTYVFHLGIFAILTLVNFASTSFLSYNKRTTQWIGILAIFLALCGINKLNVFSGTLIQLLPSLYIFYLKKEFKQDLLRFFIKIFSIVVFITAVAWTLYLFGIELPNIASIAYDSYSFENHILYVVRNVNWIVKYPRFSSIFLEPGYLGSFIALLWYASQYRANKGPYKFFLLYSLLLTFSLAAYLLLMFSFFLTRFYKSRHKIVFIGIVVVCLSGIFIFSKNYKEGDNILNVLILERLQGDGEGGIAGNNRSTAAFKDWFKRDFVRSSSLLLGTEQSLNYMSEGSGSVGVDAFVARFGLISLMFYILFLFLPCHNFRQVLLSLLYLLNFIQTSFTWYWFNYLLIFILAMNVYDKYCPTEITADCHEKHKKKD